MNQMTNVSMNNFTTNLSVSMEDVVNVFISRFEDDLIEKRKGLQKQMVTLTSELDKVIKDTKEGIISTASMYLGVSNFENDHLKLDVSVNKESVSLEWDSSIATVQIESRLSSKSVTSGYRSNDSSTVQIKLDLDPVMVGEYKSLLDQKRQVNTGLSEINSELKDISRKERKVRGLIATKKLENLGMEDLLQDQQLLALMDNSTVG